MLLSCLVGKPFANYNFEKNYPLQLGGLEILQFDVYINLLTLRFAVCIDPLRLRFAVYIDIFKQPF